MPSVFGLDNNIFSTCCNNSEVLLDFLNAIFTDNHLLVSFTDSLPSRDSAYDVTPAERLAGAYRTGNLCVNDCNQLNHSDFSSLCKQCQITQLQMWPENLNCTNGQAKSAVIVNNRFAKVDQTSHDVCTRCTENCKSKNIIIVVTWINTWKSSILSTDLQFQTNNFVLNIYVRRENRIWKEVETPYCNNVPSNEINIKPKQNMSWYQTKLFSSASAFFEQAEVKLHGIWDSP